MLNEFTKKEAPIQGLAGMGGGVPSRLLTLASGEVTYVDDVFSTFLYDGTASAQTITNGIDLDGEGGLVWAKSRSTRNHILSDTERGTGKVLFSNLSNGTDTDATTITSYNSNGFTMGTSTLKMNTSGEEFCSWTFRKCPGFFDIVTYTGNGVAGRTVAHNLGSVPGCIMIKCLDVGRNWTVYHRGLDSTAPEDYYIVLNSTADRVSDQYSTAFNSTAPTATEFTLGTGSAVNGDGNSYIAYIFAHNDGSFGESSDEAVIKCGSYTGNISNGPTVDLGFEPQWILTRSASTSGPNWYIFDNMREWSADGDMAYLRPDTTDAESSLGGASKVFNLNSRGFKVTSGSTEFNKTNDNFIYIAIRRPHKPPEAATEVFAVNTESNDNNYSTTGFPVDAAISVNRDGSSHTSLFGAKLIGENVLRTGLSNSQNAYLTYNTAYAFMDKFRYAFWGSNTDGFVNYAFKRAPKFFDVVNYSGTGSSGLTVNHNLGTTPELLIFKNRTSSSTNWFVITASQSGNLNTTGAFNSQSFISFGSSSYTINTTGNSSNASGQDYLAFLFASLAGISKVGSYTGTGSDIDVDCGFTAGARFVLIKRTDAVSDWAVFDSVRGIVSGNDPYWSPNNDAAENSNLDAIDPINSGFRVTSTASTMLNASGGTYFFLAIA